MQQRLEGAAWALTIFIGLLLVAITMAGMDGLAALALRVFALTAIALPLLDAVLHASHDGRRSLRAGWLTAAGTLLLWLMAGAGAALAGPDPAYGWFIAFLMLLLAVCSTSAVLLGRYEVMMHVGTVRRKRKRVTLAVPTEVEQLDTAAKPDLSPDVAQRRRMVR